MEWKTIWSYLTSDYRSEETNIQSQIQVIRLRSNHYGESLKIRFSNLYGVQPLLFQKITVRILSGSTLEIINEKRATLQHKEHILLEAGKEYLSDRLNLTIKPDDIVEIETEITRETIITSGVMTYSRREQEVYNYQSDSEGIRHFVDQKKIFTMVNENDRRCFFYGVRAIDALMAKGCQTIIAFGDSLTHQGFWVDHLKERFLQNKITNISVLNCGLGGNRILQGTDPEADHFLIHGEAGINRFEREVYYDALADEVIVFHGINDLIVNSQSSFSDNYIVEKIINGFKKYAQMAHQKGTRIFIATLCPLGNSKFYSEELEQNRKEINQWIRFTKEYDGFFDFERAVVDRENSKMLQKAYDSGDGLHLSDAGGNALANNIDLSVLLAGN